MKKFTTGYHTIQNCEKGGRNRSLAEYTEKTENFIAEQAYLVCSYLSYKARGLGN
jgi:hypothetical protein